MTRFLKRCHDRACRWASAIPGLTPMPIASIWNASASAPIGFYSIAFEGPFDVTDLVAVDAPEPLATFLAERGYLPKGVPLLKRILAVSRRFAARTSPLPSMASMSAWRATAIAAGRDLPVWQGCRRIATGEVFL